MMSDAKIEDAKLDKFEGPFFPKSLDGLHRMLYKKGSRNFNLWTLEPTVKKTGSKHRLNQHVRTSDNYSWFWHVKFKLGKRKKIVIALPWAKDFNNNKNTSDRHIAIYTRGDISESEIEEVVSVFTEAIRPHFKDELV